MTSEQKARVSIGVLLLQQAGWHVCNMADTNIHTARGVSLRDTRFGFADYLLYIGSKAAGVIEAKEMGRHLQRRRGSIRPLRLGPAGCAVRLAQAIALQLRVHRHLDPFVHGVNPQYGAKARLLSHQSNINPSPTSRPS